MRIAPGDEKLMFEGGRPPKTDLQPILERLRATLPDSDVKWRILSAQRKMGKTLFEIEETRGGDTRRLVGKLSKTERAETLVKALRQLWMAGWRPPDVHTVTEAVAWLTDEGAVVQELAPGRQAIDIILESPDEAARAGEQCASWLATLQASGAEAPRSRFDASLSNQHAEELKVHLPREAPRIDGIAERILSEAAQPFDVEAPSHGDFHAMNIFIDGERRITAIDMDKFGCRQAEADAGYFLTQTASFGYFKAQTFENTLTARRAYLKRYLELRQKPLNTGKMALYVAAAFLKNLHFELELLKTGRMELAAPWLYAAERAIVHGDLEMTGAVR